MNQHDKLTHVMQAYQSREEPERLHALAGKYWRLMLTVEILLFCVGVAGGAYMLVITFFDLSPGKPSTVASHNLNRVQLTKIMSSFEAREASFEELKGNQVLVEDPSR